MSAGVAGRLGAMLRVGAAGALAYRGEFFVWILTTNMPLVMLALWSRVAADGPVGRFTARGFAAYYVALLVVRFLNGSWVVWELTQDIRSGALGPRLLRPMHPFVHYATDNLAQMPLRLLVAAPLVATLLVGVGASELTRDPAQLALFPVTVAASWALQFSAMLAVASLAFFVESALSVWELWMAMGYVLSGYLVPLSLLPPAVREVALWLPWRCTLAVPLEALLGHVAREATLRGLGAQLAWTAAFLVAATTLWRRGLRRYEAFGG